MTATIAGIQIPDSTMAKDATALLRDVATQLVYDHSRRVFLFASLRGQRDGLEYDPELLYIGTMFHDLGLTERYRRTDQRFEIDAADEARRFLGDYGIDGEAADAGDVEDGLRDDGTAEHGAEVCGDDRGDRDDRERAARLRCLLCDRRLQQRRVRSER